MGILHSTATLSIQGMPSACMGFGSCTVSIFSCPASATLAGQAIFSFFVRSNPNPTVHLSYRLNCAFHLTVRTFDWSWELRTIASTKYDIDMSVCYGRLLVKDCLFHSCKLVSPVVGCVSEVRYQSQPLTGVVSTMPVFPFIDICGQKYITEIQSRSITSHWR